MKYKKSVYKTLALITQIGISMLTPILLCVVLGVVLEDKFGLKIFIPLVVLGMAAGFRNCYLLAKQFISDGEPIGRRSKPDRGEKTDTEKDSIEDKKENE